jgi:aminoglycoside phosphotransferase (APT) family kinase protein
VLVDDPKPDGVQAMLARACAADIRALKPGYAQEYYALFDGAAEYLARIVPALGFIPCEVTVRAGEEGLIACCVAAREQAVVKIAAYGGLLTTTTFYQLAGSAGIPVPAVRLWDLSSRVIPYEYLVMDLLPGKEATVLPPPMRRQAGFLTGQTLRRLHAVPAGGFGAPLDGGRWSSPSWLDALHRGYLEDGSTARKHEVFSASEIAAIEGLTVGNQALDIAEPRLIHGDPSPANSLCMHAPQVGLTGFIDPSVIIGGDPIFDLVAGTGGDEAFAAGVREGYTATCPLTTAETARFHHLRLFSTYWTACWQYATARHYQPSRTAALHLLHALQ